MAEEVPETHTSGLFLVTGNMDMPNANTFIHRVLCLAFPHTPLSHNELVCVCVFSEAAAASEHHSQPKSEPAAGAEPLPQPPQYRDHLAK